VRWTRWKVGSRRARGEQLDAQGAPRERTGLDKWKDDPVSDLYSADRVRADLLDLRELVDNAVEDPNEIRGAWRRPSTEAQRMLTAWRAQAS
jgi:hypothetical protein